MNRSTVIDAIRSGAFLIDLFLVIPIAGLIGAGTNDALANHFGHNVAGGFAIFAGTGIAGFGLYCAWISAGFMSQGKWARGLLGYSMLFVFEFALSMRHLDDGLWVLMLAAMMCHVIVGMDLADVKSTADNTLRKSVRAERQAASDAAEAEAEAEKARWEREEKQRAAERRHAFQMKKLEMDTQVETAKIQPNPVPQHRIIADERATPEPLTIPSGAMVDTESGLEDGGYDWSLRFPKWKEAQRKYAKSLDEDDLKRIQVNAGVAESTARDRIERVHGRK